MNAPGARQLNGHDPLRIIELPTVAEERGALTIMELARDLPFALQRLYYLTDVPRGATRGGHAHRLLRQVLIAIHGSFEVAVSVGGKEQSLLLDRPDRGLYLPPMSWRTVGSFSPGAVCLVLASAPYDPGDYIRDREQYLRELALESRAAK